MFPSAKKDKTCFFKCDRFFVLRVRAFNLKVLAAWRMLIWISIYQYSQEMSKFLGKNMFSCFCSPWKTNIYVKTCWGTIGTLGYRNMPLTSQFWPLQSVIRSRRATFWPRSPRSIGPSWWLRRSTWRNPVISWQCWRRPSGRGVRGSQAPQGAGSMLRSLRHRWSVDMVQPGADGSLHFQ